ncbi:hypothetical protein DAD186_12350 [Dermabacter vaginalis]|uniref:DUF3043 domain-containing protein n=1 Tax=Dermabacter vaginalis TaxID=1630135 RepID=A0A1B0ZIG4_9MICO|nr:DUF3043 domain-containing protein [Dermabacter vaginalis]ANP27785.1 hypothetical protein DAD186_12350 [Dermabacter vaginalis]
MNTETPSEHSPSPTRAEHSATTPKKGRPTRSRKEAVAARRTPLVPKDRKEAKRRSKQKDRAAANREHQALLAGDEAHYPVQHRGADRRLVRDIVDSRHNVAEYFLPFALIAMLFPFAMQLIDPVKFQVVSIVFLVVLWAGILVVVIDTFLLRRKIRKVLTERFGVVPAGMVSYGLLRSTNIRPWRMPKPQIKHGEAPRP